ncbi:hypothetical protein CEXT_670371 [Caerostris extrusa]|uniref:Uncharacterized protein n=1 Tax=Caerostris extrusa TaxID=172846 RepID=A0AAV4WHS0_CAEEX|nr:hypothetical protein CEXT_670371 [Caerostris extrusa]
MDQTCPSPCVEPASQRGHSQFWKHRSFGYRPPLLGKGEGIWRQGFRSPTFLRVLRRPLTDITCFRTNKGGWANRFRRAKWDKLVIVCSTTPAHPLLPKYEG